MFLCLWCDLQGDNAVVLYSGVTEFVSRQEHVLSIIFVVFVSPNGKT
jgi:hypothetical protein